VSSLQIRYSADYSTASRRMELVALSGVSEKQKQAINTFELWKSLRSKTKRK
jgi:hypothetical protein